MALDDTLNQAKTYTDDELGKHVAAVDAHPQYVRLENRLGTATGGQLIVLTAGQSLPPVQAGSVVFAPGGVFMANETATAWVKLGDGPIPADTIPPTVPTSLRTVSKTTNAITVAWNASTDDDTGIGGYDVSIDSGAWISLGNVLTYTFGGLAASSAHTMRVRARDNAATPNVSAAASLADSTNAAPISAPSNVRATATTTTSITFAWNAPTSGTVARYETRIGSGTFTTNGTSTTRTVTGLTQDTPYTFGVRAVASDGTVSAEVTTSARTQPTVTPPPGTGSLYVGVHVVQPTASDISNNPPLSQYSGMSQLQILVDLENEMKALTGFTDSPLMNIGHTFHSGTHNYQLKSWATTQLNRMPASIIAFKPNGGAGITEMQRTASGGDDTLIRNLITSLPVGKRIYLTYFHEPDDPGSASDAFIAAWRAATARFAKLIIDNRGARDIHPTITFTTYSFRPNIASRQALYLQVTNEFEDLGIDWRTQVVMGPDGYQQKVTGPNPGNTRSNVDARADYTLENVFPTLYARGWRRFGMGEVACCDREGQSLSGSSNSFTITATDVARAPEWVRSLFVYAASYNFEFLCWFHATGSMGPLGTWMYSDAVKTVWGQGAHFKGPGAGWTI